MFGKKLKSYEKVPISTQIFSKLKFIEQLASMWKIELCRHQLLYWTEISTMST